MSNEFANFKQELVDHVEIPDELAHELSDLLTTEKIRERMLQSVIDDPERYEIMEKKLFPITARIDVIKSIITDKHVPEKYKSNVYIWNYNSYGINGNSIEIFRNI